MASGLDLSPSPTHYYTHVVMAGKVSSGELTRELDEDDKEIFRGFLMKNHLGEMVSILEASDPTLFYSLSIEYVG